MEFRDLHVHVYIMNMKTYTASFSALSALIECLQWKKIYHMYMYVYISSGELYMSNRLMVTDSLEPILFHYGERICPERVEQKMMYTWTLLLMHALIEVHIHVRVYTC